MKKTLKTLLEQRKVLAGMAIYSGSPALVEILGYSGFDFVFIDTEHSSLGVDSNLENMIRAAEVSGLIPLVRVKGNDENLIRNALEFGAQGVVVPRIRTKEELQKAIQAGKFPLEGLRGTAAEVRAARFGTGNFKLSEYVKESNENTMVIPIAEHIDFYNNIEEIMSLDGLKLINFGPTDLAMSLGLPLLYQTDHPQIKEAFEKLVSTAKEKDKFLMGPVAPPTLERAKELAEAGLQMLIFRNDISHFRSICKRFKEEIIDRLK